MSTQQKAHLHSNSSKPFINPVAPQVYSAAIEYRLDRVRQQLKANNCAAILLYNPINIRYATDSSNMQVWTLHNFARYAMVFADGPVILWEFHNCDHLLIGNQLIDEVRTAVNWSYFGAGSRIEERSGIWAKEIRDTLDLYGNGNTRLAIDKLDLPGLSLLSKEDINILNGQNMMEEARKIKSAEELALIRWTIAVCEKGIQRMHDELRPGMSENELWAWLHHENIKYGGEWIETRLLSSGPRTNPWMQESSNRVMQRGEIISFDTDLIGPYGYCADISRAWTVGHVPPTKQQREIYTLAYQQIQHNMGLLKAGVSYRDFTEAAWPIPKKYYKNRYNCVAHGIGLVDEAPAIAHKGNDWDKSGYDGIFESGMVICVESYIGAEDGTEGVKLEQQVLITESGIEELSSYPWQTDWLE